MFGELLLDSFGLKEKIKVMNQPNTFLSYILIE